MKRFKLFAILFAMISVVSFSCTNKELESRIAKLEGRVAELESKGGLKTKAPTKSTANNSTAKATKEPEVKPDGPLPEFTFEEELHDFGTIDEGEVVDHTFVFTNTGDAPLLISGAKGSCGCTVPEWPKEPIAVGEQGEIKVKFNSRKKPGIQNKTVTITSNTFPTQKRIKIKANVTPAPKDEKDPA